MIEDYIYEFKAPNGVQSKCRIRTFQNKTPRTLHHGDFLIVASQLMDSDAGMSVTNAAEHIASGVMKRHGANPLRTVWIEHYPARGRSIEESFDRVTFALAFCDMRSTRLRLEGLLSKFTLAHALWNHITREVVEQLIGEKFPG